MSPTQSSPFSRPLQIHIERVVVAVLWARGPARRARPQIHRTRSDRAMDEALAFLSKQREQPPPRHLTRAVTLFFSPFVGPTRCHSGMLQAERRGSSARSTTRPYSYPVRWPATADPATMMPDSGRCDVPGGGTHLRKRCRGLPANHASLRSHALPGFPGSPVGPPGCSGVSFPPLRPATGRRLPAPARRSRSATAPPAACAPAPRSPASANARRGR